MSRHVSSCLVHLAFYCDCILPALAACVDSKVVVTWHDEGNLKPVQTSFMHRQWSQHVTTNMFQLKKIQVGRSHTTLEQPLPCQPFRVCEFECTHETMMRGLLPESLHTIDGGTKSCLICLRCNGFWLESLTRIVTGTVMQRC